jgi:hypothetical protein
MRQRLFQSAFHTAHEINKSFNLRMIKRVDLEYPPYEINELIRGCKSFYDRCWAPKIRNTNPTCLLRLKVKEDGPPKIRVEFEDGRKINIEDASYLPASFIAELVLMKKQKMKRHYEILDMDYYDTDEEEDPFPEMEDDGKKKKKKAGGKK